VIRHISAQCPNSALHDALYALGHFGLEEDSRNGKVVVNPHPVITTYTHPRNRVLVSTTRDANPFFHLFEAMWMLAGRNDLAFPQTFISDFGKFSDDGVTLHGAYGYRWRNWFGYDQLAQIIGELKNDPKTRRAVLTMWDPTSDLHMAADGGKDVPCNTHAYFDTLGGKLNMTVLCRSNDAIWGAYGANVVHFSFLLEYVALMTGIPMGVYRQFSNNMHIYENVLPRSRFYRYADDVLAHSTYSTSGAMKNRVYGALINQIALINDDAEAFHADLQGFCDLVTVGGAVPPHSKFFASVVHPMFAAWISWKDKDYDRAAAVARSIAADDWRMAATSWLDIRAAKRSNVDV
jgi:Thymidylate synthase